ncbi:hypothetical protein QFC22_006400 [Naganishia vaughanmartiniae]|uniref:Uncharacterized protein n=1 Tax=Naganishia vaughanmartiniae TaxID=1424756 RepID=A0ACC2WL90_9TREE|nr:hypothetical protein QFC22_006400 [Naganishia vaughanmartiniae]
MGLFKKRPGSALAPNTGIVASTPSGQGYAGGSNGGGRFAAGSGSGLGLGLRGMTVGMWVLWVFAFIGFWVSFISMCVGEAGLNSATGGPAMGTLWFAIIFQAAVIVHLTLAIARSTLPAHRLQLCFILAILIVFAVNGVEYIYQGQARARAGLDYAGALKAVGAGWLMLAIVDIIWLLWLSSEEDTFLHRTIFSSTMTSARAPVAGGHQQQPYIDGRPVSYGGGGAGAGDSGGAAGQEDPYAAHGTTYPPGMNGYHAAPLGTPVRVVTREREYANAVGAGGPVGSTTMTTGAIAGTSLGQSHPSMASDGQYKLRAKALYAYTASPDDPNEVSFVKGEVLDIMDASGKWWQCRNQNGQVGNVDQFAALAFALRVWSSPTSDYSHANHVTLPRLASL